MTAGAFNDWWLRNGGLPGEYLLVLAAIGAVSTAFACTLMFLVVDPLSRLIGQAIKDWQARRENLGRQNLVDDIARIAFDTRLRLLETVVKHRDRGTAGWLGGDDDA
jgi:hypothetical protein